MKISVLFTQALAVMIATAGMASANVLVSQSSDFNGAFVSQTDINNGDTALVYDNFSTTSNQQLTDVTWVGTYGNGTVLAPDSFTIGVYAGIGGPGLGHLVGSVNVAVGSYTETQTGQDSVGDQQYSYAASIVPPIIVQRNHEYWLSIVANTPTQYDPKSSIIAGWSWSTSSGGDLASYQDYLGIRYSRATDFAFSITSSDPVQGLSIPEPGTVSLFSLGLVGLGLFRALKKRTPNVASV